MYETLFPQIWFYFFFFTKNKDISISLARETFGDFFKSGYKYSIHTDYLNSLFLIAKKNSQAYMILTFGHDQFTEQNYFIAEVYARLRAMQIEAMLKL